MTTRARPSQERRPAAKASTAKITAGVPGSGQARTVRVPWAFSAVPAIRRTIVADLVVPGVSAEVIDEAEIVVSELVANALRHARALPDGTVRVHWKVKNGAVEVEVTDGGGDTAPRPAPRVHVGAAGRGLRIVRSLAHEWGVTRTGAAAPCGSPSAAPPGAAAPDRRSARSRNSGAARRSRVGPPWARHPGAAWTAQTPASGPGRRAEGPRRGRRRSSRARSRGCPGETDWVAMREIVPAATATVRLRPAPCPPSAPQR